MKYEDFTENNDLQHEKANINIICRSEFLFVCIIPVEIDSAVFFMKH